jgi:mannose-6-phosphate isomerase-like protein (cupin superfamily)
VFEQQIYQKNTGRRRIIRGGGSMRSVLALAVALFATVLLNAQGAQPARGQAPAPPKPLTGAVFIDHAKVAETFAKGGTMINAPDLSVQGSHREVPGRVEVHDKETDVLYMISGAATFVVGGTMNGGRVTRPGQWQGADISGGETHQLAPGDIIVIPAGMPHWFKTVSPQITYYVVKVLKP